MKNHLLPSPALIVFVLCMFAPMISAQPALAGTPTDSSDQIAERIVNSKKPVLIDFWAAWCGPCRLLNPIIKELEQEYHGKIEFIKINVDQHRGISQYFQTNSIPAVFIVKDKTVINSIPGLRDKETYRRALDAALIKTVPARPSRSDSSDARK